MAALEELKPGCSIRGVLPGGIVTVVSVQWFGSDAIELLRARGEEIDLLLLDMTIPGAPSEEVLAEAVRARPDLKIILTSAYSEEMAHTKLRAPQVRGFVRKPFQLEELVRVFRNALSLEARA